MPFKLRSEDNDTLRLMFRVQDNDIYYRFTWDKQRITRRLVKRVGGVFSLLASDNVPFVQGHDYQVEIVAQGGQLEVRVDGARIFQVSDASIAVGSIACQTWMKNGAYSGDLAVNAMG